MSPLSRALALSLCSLAALSLAAQEPASKWDSLKLLTPGIDLQVVSTASGKPIQGKLKTVTDNDLVLVKGGHDTSFSRTDIVRVSARQKGRRLRNALIGLGVGTAAGALIGFGIGHSQASNCMKSGGGWCGLDSAAGAAVGGLSGMVSGTVVGALWRTGKWNEVYAR